MASQTTSIDALDLTDSQPGQIQDQSIPSRKAAIRDGMGGYMIEDGNFGQDLTDSSTIETSSVPSVSTTTTTNGKSADIMSSAAAMEKEREEINALHKKPGIPSE